MFTMSDLVIQFIHIKLINVFYNVPIGFDTGVTERTCMSQAVLGTPSQNHGQGNSGGQTCINVKMLCK